MFSILSICGMRARVYSSAEGTSLPKYGVYLHMLTYTFKFCGENPLDCKSLWSNLLPAANKNI